MSNRQIKVTFRTLTPYNSKTNLDKIGAEFGTDLLRLF